MVLSIIALVFAAGMIAGRKTAPKSTAWVVPQVPAMPSALAPTQYVVIMPPAMWPQEQPKTLAQRQAEWDKAKVDAANDPAMKEFFTTLEEWSRTLSNR